MTLRVPQQQIAIFKMLLEQPEDKADQFVDALAKAGLHFNIADLSEDVARQLKAPLEFTQGIMSVLASLYLTRDNEHALLETFVDEGVFFALGQAGAFPGKAKGHTDPNQQWTRLRKFLISTLSMERTLGTAAKAGYILTQHERIFVAARIATDIRPIFHLDVSEKPESALIIHMLRITQRDNFGKHSDKYFALDSNDIKSLKRLVDRALKKEETLRNLMKDANVAILNPKETF